MHSTRSADLGWVNTHAYNFFVCGPNFTNFFFVQRGRDRGRSHLFPIFDILIRGGDIRGQVQSCPKSRRIFYVFAVRNVWGAGPHKICTQIIMPASWHVTWKSLVGLRPLAPKL